MRRSAYSVLVGSLSLLACACHDPVQSELPANTQAAAAERGTREPTRDEAETPAGEQTGESSSLAIFTQRILPIFQSAKPSSCAECHLSGVDLKDYIRPTQQQTFASLVAAGLIDTQQPDRSRILDFIRRKPEQSSLVPDAVRQKEYEAFRGWIRAAVRDPDLLNAQTAVPIGPELPVEVIRHARKDRVLASFVDNVWTEVGRCAACHSPDRNQQQVEKHGDQVSWITLRDPQATLDYMVEAGLIDTEQPEKSLLVMKPTLQVEHGGGQKMVIGDRTYKQFRRFIDDYAAMVRGEYDSAEALPAPSQEVSVVTDIWLRIDGVPARFDKMLLQVDLYRQTDEGWSPFRVATSDRPVFGAENRWQHSLSLTARRGTPWAEKLESKQLPAGRYLLKLYVDQQGKLEQDFRSELGEADFVGELQIESQWPAGYGRMTVVNFPK